MWGVPMCGCWLPLSQCLSFSPTRARKDFQCWLHSAQHPRRGRRMAGCGDHIRGEKKAALSNLFLPECILVFHPAFSGSSEQGPAFLHSKPRLLFLFEGQKGCVPITWLLKGWSGLSVYLQARGDQLFHGLHITWQLITSWRGEWWKCPRSSSGCCYRRSFWSCANQLHGFECPGARG